MKTTFKILALIIFLFLTVYGSEGSCDPNTNNSSLIGSWLYNPGSLADSAVLTFIDNTNYMFAVDGDPDDGGGRGMERGTYTWDSSTGVFTATSISNTAGDWGIASLNTTTVTIDGDTLNLVDSVDGLIPFTRVSSGTNTIISGWLYNPDSLDDSAVLTFIDNTNYMFAVDGNPDDGGGRGMERGTYTWDSSTGVFTATSISNTAGDWGISYLNTMTVTINGDTLNLVDSVDGLIPFTRVSSGTNPIISSILIILLL
ncbi:MAG: hypothetical protein KAR45_23250 [Desulfobacteraceae bacterium]|nr:hypothetical protein [Desulfobacteraceae bacterium]